MDQEKEFESKDIFKIYKMTWDLRERMIRLETRMTFVNCQKNEKKIDYIIDRISKNTLRIEKSKNAIMFSVISILIGLISSSAALFVAFKK